MPQGSNGWRSSGTSWQHPNGDVPMLKWRHWSMARPPIDHIGWLYYVLLPGFRKIPTLTLRKPSPGHKAPLSRQHWASDTPGHWRRRAGPRPGQNASGHEPILRPFTPCSSPCQERANVKELCAGCACRLLHGRRC